jgi:hypothetical protein
MAKTKIYVLDEENTRPSLLDFLQGEIPKISIANERCPHCGLPIQFPIVIHPEHYRAMIIIIDLALDYMAKKDILPEDIWNSLRDEINKQITIH